MLANSECSDFYSIFFFFFFFFVCIREDDNFCVPYWNGRLSPTTVRLLPGLLLAWQRLAELPLRCFRFPLDPAALAALLSCSPLLLFGAVVVVASVVIATGVSSVSSGIRASRALRSSGSSNVDVEEVRIVDGTLVEGLEKCLPMSSMFRRMVTSLAENAGLLPNSRVIITALRSVLRVGWITSSSLAIAFPSTHLFSSWR